LIEDISFEVIKMKRFVSKNDVTIVIPTLNEELAIGQVLKEVHQEGYRNILIVDGYSTDNTVNIAKKNGGNIVFQHAHGKTGGIKTAIDHVKTPYFLVMDGDCTYDPTDIDKFLPHAQNYDQIIGCRVKGRDNIPILNRLGNWLINKVFNLLMGTNLSDVCSGMYMLKRETAQNFEMNTGGFDVEVEVAAQAATSGKITEVPITYRKRVGRQKLSLKHGFQILLTIVKLGRKYNPAFLFSMAAGLLMIPAAIILIWVASEVLLLGVWHSGYAITGVMLLLLASQAITVSSISVLIKRMENRIIRKLAQTNHD
jgi:glycosyltransferase involved in cell wall biosynthesis